MASAEFFMRPNIDVVLDVVMCSGGESSPSECSFGTQLGFPSTSCSNASEVAGVRCEQTFGELHFRGFSFFKLAS